MEMFFHTRKAKNQAVASLLTIRVLMQIEEQKSRSEMPLVWQAKLSQTNNGLDLALFGAAHLQP